VPPSQPVGVLVLLLLSGKRAMKLCIFLRLQRTIKQPVNSPLLPYYHLLAYARLFVPTNLFCLLTTNILAYDKMIRATHQPQSNIEIRGATHTTSDSRPHQGRQGGAQHKNQASREESAWCVRRGSEEAGLLLVVQEKNKSSALNCLGIGRSSTSIIIGFFKFGLFNNDPTVSMSARLKGITKSIALC
jgi:hypothetical protein